MTLHEPVTLVTDYLLAAVALWLAARLRRQTTDIAARWLARALVLTAASAFLGGSYHGFAGNVPRAWAAAWWVATLLVICLVSAALAMSLLREFTRSTKSTPWTWLIAAKLGVSATLVLLDPRFMIAIADYGSVLLAWAIGALVTRRAWRGWMLGAVGLCVIGALVQQARIAPSPHFNHNDLYHVIQAFALGAFYRAGLRFGEHAAPAPP
jgi:hypothetical protein